MALPFAAGVIDGDVLPICEGTAFLPDAIEASAPLQASSSYDVVDEDAMLLPKAEPVDAQLGFLHQPLAVDGHAQLGFLHQPLAVHDDELLCALPTLAEDGDHSQCALPSMEPPSPIPPKRARRQCERGSGQGMWSRPHLRKEALADIPKIAAKYGSDLLNVDPPPDWCDRAKCEALLSSLSIAFATLPLFLLEIFAGCARLTEVANSLGLAVGPAVDIDPAIGGGMSYNLLLPEYRKIVWALIVVGLPRWVHVGFPCTFWTQMAHFQETRSSVERKH